MSIKRNKRNMVNAAVLAAALALSSSAAELWVATTGSDAPGTAGDASAPFLTLTNALAHASDYDTIRFRAGTYPVTKNVNGDTPWAVIDKAVTIISEDGPATTAFDGGNVSPVYPFQITSAGATLAGFTIRNFKSASTWTLGLGGIIHNSGGGTVSNCVFRDCSSFYYGTIRTFSGTVVDCTFQNCVATDSNGRGGGIAVASGSALVERCLFDGCSARSASAIHINSGSSGTVVRDCVIRNCASTGTYRDAAGTVYVLSGLVERCIVTNNSTQITSGSFKGAGGVYIAGGTLRNSLVADNRITSPNAAGGGIYQSGASTLVENCTVTGNRLGSNEAAGQGLYQAAGTLRNSVVAFNGHTGNFADTLNGVFNGTVAYSCTYPAAAGDGNISQDPLFDTSSPWPGYPSPMSPLVDRGSAPSWALESGAVDVAGAARVAGAAIDMGAFELDPSSVAFACQMQLSSVLGVFPASIDLAVSWAGAPGAVEAITWNFGDGTVATGPAATSHVYTAAGSYTPSVTVTSGGRTVSDTASAPIVVGPPATYVAPGGDGVWPYDTPAKATSNILAAVEALVFPTTTTRLRVHVAPGRYFIPATADASTPWLKILNPVEIVSDAGPEQTFIDGGWNGRGTGANRYFAYINSSLAVLDGFTIENVYSEVNYQIVQSGTIHLLAGLVTNCVIRNNSFYYAGAVTMANGTLADCVVSNNVSRDGASTGCVSIRSGAGRVVNTLISGNVFKEGAGVLVDVNSSKAVVSNCVIRGNTCEYTTRGSYGCNVIANGLVTDCVITNNIGYSGGGALLTGGTLRNSIVAGNVCEGNNGGGGVYMTGGTLDGCTVAGNTATLAAARQGVYMTGGTMVNTIVAFNGTSGVFADEANFVKTGGTVTYSCLYPATAGTGNVSSDPRFTAAEEGDFTLSPASPCIDAGTASNWMTGFDVFGNARVVGSAPDIGCCEFDPASVPFSCDMTIVNAQGFAPLETTFQATAVNPPGAIDSIRWDFGDGTTGSGAETAHTYSSPGKYTVTLTVTSGVSVADKVQPNAVAVGSPSLTAYVATDGAHVWPFHTPATASTNFQEAIDAILLPDSSSVGRVVVAPGLYRLRTYGSSQVMVPEISISRPIEVVSAEGAASTVIDGGGQSSERTRGVHISHSSAAFRGFTIRGIRSAISSKSEGGVLHLTAGTVSDCAFTNNTCTWCAAAVVSGGVLENCLFADNASSDSAGEGGAIRVTGTGFVRNCVVERCKAIYGSGMWVKGASAVVSNCVIRGCSLYAATSRGFGGAPLELCNGLAVNCVVTNNSGGAAGGVTTYNGYTGASGVAPVLRNCLVAHNKASGYGSNALGAGGIYHGCGTIENCTVAGNGVTGSCAVGGILGQVMSGTPVIRNTIAWGNSPVEHSVASGVTVATSSLGVDPVFKTGRYELGGGSPCRDAGTWQDWMRNAVDLAGQPRVFAGAVDLGCYEFILSRTLLQLR